MDHASICSSHDNFVLNEDNRCFHDWSKRCNAGWCVYVYKPISFKPGIMEFPEKHSVLYKFEWLWPSDKVKMKYITLLQHACLCTSWKKDSLHLDMYPQLFKFRVRILLSHWKHRNRELMDLNKLNNRSTWMWYGANLCKPDEFHSHFSKEANAEKYIIVLWIWIIWAFALLVCFSGVQGKWWPAHL